MLQGLQDFMLSCTSARKKAKGFQTPLDRAHNKKVSLRPGDELHPFSIQ